MTLDDRVGITDIDVVLRICALLGRLGADGEARSPTVTPPVPVLRGQANVV